MAITGFQDLHPDITLNFMMNRMSRDIDSEELKAFGKDITTLDGWTEAALGAGEASEADGRFKEAAAWFRGAEFSSPPITPERLRPLIASWQPSRKCDPTYQRAAPTWPMKGVCSRPLIFRQRARKRMWSLPAAGLTGSSRKCLLRWNCWPPKAIGSSLRRAGTGCSASPLALAHARGLGEAGGGGAQSL